MVLIRARRHQRSTRRATNALLWIPGNLIACGSLVARVFGGASPRLEAHPQRQFFLRMLLLVRVSQQRLIKSRPTLSSISVLVRLLLISILRPAETTHHLSLLSTLRCAEPASFAAPSIAPARPTLAIGRNSIADSTSPRSIALSWRCVPRVRSFSTPSLTFPIIPARASTDLKSAAVRGEKRPAARMIPESRLITIWSSKFIRIVPKLFLQVPLNFFVVLIPEIAGKR